MTAEEFFVTADALCPTPEWWTIAEVRREHGNETKYRIHAISASDERSAVGERDIERDGADPAAVLAAMREALSPRSLGDDVIAGEARS